MKQAAIDIRDILKVLGLESWPLLSGGRGIHVVVPLSPRADWSEVKKFCQHFAELLARTDRQQFVANMSKAKRAGRMFIDYLRNGQGSLPQFALGPRARAGASVALPFGWDEITSIDRANTFDIFKAASRADVWADYFSTRQSLTKKMRDAVRR